MVIGGPNIKSEIMRLRIEKRKQLRVGQKNVYVPAFSMIDLEHHRCAPA